MVRAPRTLRRAARAEDGYASFGAVAALAMALLAGGSAVDVSNAWRVREILQSTAEAAAYSAAVRLSEPRLDQTPRAVAHATAIEALETYELGDAWQGDSFELGRVDGAGTFQPGALPPDAVRVTLRRSPARGNPEPMILLRVFGFDPWSIRGRAVAEIRTRPSVRCRDPLLSLQARADVSALNAYVGICLYANAQVDYGDAPVWKTPEVAALLDDLLAAATTPPGLGLPGPGSAGLSHATLRRAVDSATANIRAEDLDDLRVLSDGSLRIACGERAVARLGDGFVIENAAIFADCPIRFGTDVELRAALVVSDVTSVLRDLPEMRLTPDAVLTGSPPCMQGSGLKVLLFADLDIVSDIPALVATNRPLGRLLDDVAAGTGGVLGEAQDVLGGLLSEVSREVTEVATDFAHLPVCLGLETMLDRNTVVLR